VAVGGAKCDRTVGWRRWVGTGAGAGSVEVRSTPYIPGTLDPRIRDQANRKVEDLFKRYGLVIGDRIAVPVAQGHRKPRGRRAHTSRSL
jgi:hypothetical protein